MCMLFHKNIEPIIELLYVIVFATLSPDSTLYLHAVLFSNTNHIFFLPHKSQMFRLTIRSSKETVTNEVAELLIDQF